MRDVGRTIAFIERGMLRGLDRKLAATAPSALPKGMLPSGAISRGRVPKSSIRGWRAPVSASDAEVVYPIEQIFKPKSKPNDKPQDTSRNSSMTTRLTLSARALKITVALDAMEVRALPDPGGQASRCQLAITCEGKIYTADIATKALRKAKSTISANGAENVFAMVTGKLKGSEIIECGLVAQVKTPKPSSAAAPAATTVEAATA
jgi:hypothetical protein